MRYETIRKVWGWALVSMLVVFLVTVGVGVSKGQQTYNPPVHPNEIVFDRYPSDDTAYNEIHRYFGDCYVFGEVAAACYDGGYDLKTKSQVADKISKKHWIMSQGQIDMCNMMFNKGTYDQFMGKDMKRLTGIMDNISGYCKTSLQGMSEKEFNKDYGTKK